MTDQRSMRQAALPIGAALLLVTLLIDIVNAMRGRLEVIDEGKGDAI